MIDGGANSTMKTAANTENISVQAGSIDIDRDAYANSCLTTDYLVTPFTLTGNVFNTNILSKTLTRGRFAPTITSIRKPQHIEGKAFGRINSTLAGDVEFKFRIDGTAAAGVTVGAGQAAADFVIDFSIVFPAPNIQRLSLRMTVHLRAAQLADINDESLDMTLADRQLSLQCQLTNATDSVTFKHVHFKTVG